MIEKRSNIWKLPSDDFERILKESETYKEALITMGFAAKSGGNYKTLKQRILRDNIDVSHIENNKKKFRGTTNEISIDDAFVIGSNLSSKSLKKKLFKNKLLEEKCSKCGLENQWEGEPISLQLDHINGNHDDNKLDNLRILCPNCHSQTKTFGGRNSKRSINWTCKCGKRKHKQSNVCHECRERPLKIDWLPNDQLILKLQTQSMVSLGKELGVSDNAIRKRLKKPAN